MGFILCNSYLQNPDKLFQTHAAEEKKKLTTAVRRKLGKKNLKGYVLTLPSPSNQFICIVTTIIGCIHEPTTKCLFRSMSFHLYSHHNHDKDLIVLISQNTFKIYMTKSKSSEIVPLFFTFLSKYILMLKKQYTKKLLT